MRKCGNLEQGPFRGPHCRSSFGFTWLVDESRKYLRELVVVVVVIVRCPHDNSLGNRVGALSFLIEQDRQSVTEASRQTIVTAKPAKSANAMPLWDELLSQKSQVRFFLRAERGEGQCSRSRNEAQMRLHQNFASVLEPLSTLRGFPPAEKFEEARCWTPQRHTSNFSWYFFLG